MAERAHRPDPPATEDASPATETHTCTVAFCPICLAVSAVQPLAPEVVEHLVKAGTELLLAVRAVLDARTDQATPDGEAGRRLERIDIA
jgi:hypothetical protein